ncbi:putative lysM domain receptor-like kinase 4-like [Capsicum annuum]|uniref:helicase protein MOM1 isoform X1 n=1 Tax=Capsicum annuum TaxID=4072 RepID=UPI0007BF722F|nr:helicase protein MOM1 isoform X1 [Capsicum annuum]XP_047255915.1 helicase protein MOM1 isoform X1 [Capsicum annuum]XP_047255916.1 helicase protein MOM1 isoform X1 [Capsicum annuum]XP_047255918.1 helicase protein MOM1 isoform X1 [Capsicum annuum]KAF3665811.1 putative lysM domain receptor-like kinase 4-like [Capsicum annuum]
MAIDAGSGSKSKDSNGSNSKNKFVSKGSSSFDLGKTGVSTRSSVKATSSKQMDLRPAYKRKSERLEKRPPPMPSAKKKSGRLEQQNAPSHLRRSERFSTSSVSKHLGGESSSSSIKEEKREKIVKKLTMESESVSTRNKNYTTPVDLKRKKMDSRAYRLLFKKRKKENIASDVCEDDGTDGEHGSKSQSSPLHDIDLVEPPKSQSSPLHDTDVVEPEERRMLYDEQKNLHIHLKAEIAKLFGVIKVSEVIKRMAEKFLEYIMENHRVSREPETILQAFQISVSWTAASILKEKIDKDYIFSLVKQQLKFRCTKEEANNVYLKLRSLKKMFLQRLDQNGSVSSSSRHPISPVKSVGEEPSKDSTSQAVKSTQLNVETDTIDRLQDNELSGEGTVTPTEKLRASQREKVVKEVQCGHGKRISMLEQEEKEKIEEFHRRWEKKKEVIEDECRLEIAVLRAIHGENAATKDRQKSLESKFAKKIEAHTRDKDQQLKELEAKYAATRNEEMQKVSSQRTRENSSGRGPYSGGELECSQENLNVVDSIPKTTVSDFQGDMAASDAPASSPDACDVLPVQSTNVLAASGSEEPAEITSTERASVAAAKQFNDAGNSGGSEENIVRKVPPSPKEHAGEIASDKRSRDCLEISEVSFNEAVGHDKISVVNNTIQELVKENSSSLPNVVGKQRDEVSSIDRNQTTPEELPADLPRVAAVPSSDDASSLPQNLVNLDECSRSSGDNETNNNDMPLGENQIGMQTELVSEHTINNTSEAILAGSCEQHHRVYDGVPVATHHTHRECAPQAHDERNSTPIPGSSPHATEPSRQVVSPAGGNPEPCTSVRSDVRVTNNQSSLPAVSRVHPQSTTNLCGSSTMPVRPVHQMANTNLVLPFHADPLHIEWEKIHKEKEQATKGLEDLKLHLRSECKKEIEVAISSISKKYDLKLQEVEAVYLLKKKELDMNQSKILMNKALADAFRFTCLDVKIPDFPVAPPGYMPHLHPVRQQQILRSSPISSSSPARQPVPARQTSISSSPVANCSVHSAETSLPPLRSSAVAGSSSSQPAAVSRSTVFSAGSVSRPPPPPPLISAITPSRGNHRLGGEFRAPAPHLQRFKGPTSTPVSSSSTLPNGMTVHPRPVYVAASLRPALQNQIQPPIVQQLPVNLPDTGNASSNRGLGVGMPAIQSPSLSARELLQEMENRSRANRPNFMPPLPDIGCNFDSLDLSEFHSPGSVQGGAISSETVANVSGVVCLSDDD